MRRVREELAGDDRNLLSNQTKQDAIVAESLDDFLVFTRILLKG